MDLSSFITMNREVILADWEKDTRRRIEKVQAVGIAELRDNVDELLDTVASDLSDCRRTADTAGEATTGRLPDGGIEAVAEKHGARRARQGLCVAEVALEFPTLRACVTRLWRRSQPAPTPADLDTLICFDAAIDRALTKSVAELTHRIDQSRETLLGILSHDLRDPLTTIIAGGGLLAEGGVDEAATRDVAHRIVSTGQRMHHLVADLLDATRMRFGGRLPIERRESDLGAAVRGIADEFATSHPDRSLAVSVTGNLHGQWDDKRIGQAVANLLANAFQHGQDHSPIRVSVGADDEVTIAVHNDGPSIPDERRAVLFEPWSNVIYGETVAREAGHLGLGLYIAKAIVTGHGGHIDVDSTHDRGTTFTIHLPVTRDAAATT